MAKKPSKNLVTKPAAAKTSRPAPASSPLVPTVATEPSATVTAASGRRPAPVFYDDTDPVGGQELISDGDVPTELWPFGAEPAPFKGFVRSQDLTRDEAVIDLGHGIRVYPSSTGGPSHIVNSTKGTCSSDYCQNLVGSCAHRWEDDFRFGPYAGVHYVLPKRIVRKPGERPGWNEIERYIPRPNPVVDGRKYATIMKEARVNMAVEARDHLAAVARYLRSKAVEKRYVDDESAKVGRPSADIWDVAMMAILRMGNDWSYERTQDEINRFVSEGVFEKPFRFPRINEQMMDLPLAGAVREMSAHMAKFFRDVTRVGVVDGMILSTNKTDNARSGHFTSRPKTVLTELHTMYEIRWGFIMSHQLTWFARGRGSGEAPQYPFLMHDAKMWHPNLNMIQGDLAYGSENNFARSLAAGITLLVPVPAEAFKRPKILTPAQVEHIRRTNGPDSPLVQQVFRFRNIGEGWNETQRAVMSRHLKTVPDRSIMPTRKVDMKQFKSKPELAEMDLPREDEKRAWVIATEQFVGRSCHNEMLCRQAWTYVRALVKASAYYGQRVNMACVTPFQPRPEDEEFSIFRVALPKPNITGQ